MNDESKNIKNKKLQTSKKKNNSNLDWYYNNNFKKKNNKNNRNNNYNRNNKNNSLKKNNSIIKNIENEIKEDNINLGTKEEKDFNISIEVRKSFWDKVNILSKKYKKKKVLDTDIIEKEENDNNKKKFWNKLNIFKKDKKEKKNQIKYANNKNYNKKENKDSFWNKINIFKKKDKVNKKNVKQKNKKEYKKDNKISFWNKINIFKKRKEIKKNKEDLDKTILIKKNKIKNDVDLDKTIIVKKKNKNNNSNNNSNNKIINNIEHSRTLYGSNSLNLNSFPDAKKKRKKTYFKEALFVSLIFSIINIVAYFLIDNSLIISITNLEYVNIIFTFIFNFILLFTISFIIDWIITEYIVRSKRKKQLKEGGSYRNRWFIKGEDKENIGIKKRK